MARSIRLHEHALGLLYLLRGRVPVAIGVLAEPGSGPLEGSREASVFSEWLGETAEREFNWLRIEPTAPVESWLEPAMLWWAPSDLSAWSDDAFDASLRRFLVSGGLLIADFGRLAARDRETAKARLASLLPGSEWKRTEPTHPSQKALFALSNRARRPSRSATAPAIS